MSYTDQVSPQEVMEAVARGRKRLKNFRNARLLFLRNFTGPYYDRAAGNIGKEPLNLIFNAIRVIVPNIVMSFPKHTVTTPYLMAKQYADLAGLAMDQHDKQIDITSIYRRVIVDAFFALGIMKTGLASGDTIYAIDDLDPIDAGTVYTEAVDFDNFVADPNSKEHLFKDAGFLGDILCVPRRLLLDSGQYKNDFVEKLPCAGEDAKNRAYNLSMKTIDPYENAEFEDMVEVVELYVPSANAIVTVPADESVSFDDYLRVTDFYGVKEGPYTLLALTPPVPGNPLPIPSVGVWNDLHIKANEMASKIIEQATRQKDVLGYRRASADDAESLKEAKDGDAVAMDDPTGAQMYSYGGQKNSNEAHLMQLQGWFNMMAGNPQQMGGTAAESNTATGTVLLQQNASIGLEDMKNLVYEAARSESRKRFWYFHTDPMMHIPLTKRQPMPAQYLNTPTGPIQVMPPMMNDVQVILTPEARRGEFIDFMFEIEPESMGRKDSKTRYMQCMEFCTKTLPAVLTAAQAAMMMGLPFSAKAMMMRAAKEAGIDWMDEVFYDPEFQMQLMQQAAMGPQAAASKGQAQPSPNGGNAGLPALMQNGQPANVMANATPPDTQMRMDQQAGAAPGQQMVKQY